MDKGGNCRVGEQERHLHNLTHGHATFKMAGPKHAADINDAGDNGVIGVLVLDQLLSGENDYLNRLTNGCGALFYHLRPGDPGIRVKHIRWWD